MINYSFLWLRATIRKVAKPEDTSFYGKTDGLFVMSFATYPKKGNVFPLYTSFINLWMNVKESSGFPPFESAPFEFDPDFDFFLSVLSKWSLIWKRTNNYLILFAAFEFEFDSRFEVRTLSSIEFYLLTYHENVRFRIISTELTLSA